jgi:pimeloyl-ACP methyl ester carboxylesterase
MMDVNFPPITDWSAAYNNRAAVPEVGAWAAALTEASQAWRAAFGGRVESDIAYGEHPRERYDLWHPDSTARGTVAFVHGGYWRSGDKAWYWALGRPLLQAGWRVAFIGYPLCPEVTIGRITQSAAAALTHVAARVPDGPLVLAGHSAGGHLVTWLASTASPLDAAVRRRIPRVVSLSGVHDLRPVCRSDELNVDLRLSAAEAAALSPVLHGPAHAFALVCMCGAAELPEFRRQNVLLANLWSGLGVVSSQAVEIDAANHFTLLDGLVHEADGGPIGRSLLG